MLPWKFFENFTYCNGHINSDGGSNSKVGGPKSNDQISFAYSPYLSCPHVTCPIYVGFRPTVLASGFCITIKFLMS